MTYIELIETYNIGHTVLDWIDESFNEKNQFESDIYFPPIFDIYSIPSDM
jgi:hypothetical protein